MSLEPLPAFACWRHFTAREGSVISYVGEAEGRLDVDLEASVLTNTLPVHRFAALGARPDPVSAPAPFVRTS